MLDRLPRRSIPESHPPPWSPPSSSLGGSLSQTELFRRSLLELHQEGYGIDDIDASVECDSGTSVAEAGGDALDEERKRVEEREMAVGRSSPDTVLDKNHRLNPEVATALAPSGLAGCPRPRCQHSLPYLDK